MLQYHRLKFWNFLSTCCTHELNEKVLQAQIYSKFYSHFSSVWTSGSVDLFELCLKNWHRMAICWLSESCKKALARASFEALLTASQQRIQETTFSISDDLARGIFQINCKKKTNSLKEHIMLYLAPAYLAPCSAETVSASQIRTLVRKVFSTQQGEGAPSHRYVHTANTEWLS